VAIPAAQSSAWTRVTAFGPLPLPVAGNAASATPAAVAIGSALATRVVLLVANAGKPRSDGSSVCSSASGALTITCGAGPTGESASSPRSSLTPYTAPAVTAPIARRESTPRTGWARTQ
jgi:hypothetical protein